MDTSPKDESNSKRPLRLWPGVVAVVLQWLAWLGAPLIFSGITAGYIAVLGLLFGGLAILVWWAFFSRAPGFERWAAVLLIVLALFTTPLFLHESIAKGMMGLMFFIYAIPILSLAFVAWAVASQYLSASYRRVAMVGTIMLACGVLTLVRSEGITGEGTAEFAWRWTETPEQRLMVRVANDRSGESSKVHESRDSMRSRGEDRPVAAQPAVEVDEPPVEVPKPSVTAATAVEMKWPGFRGPNRNGVIPNIQIETNWEAFPPVELWRRPVGPGWSSFAVNGDFFYTQEQRGDEEIVSCYKLQTGEPVWKHRDTARFWEANAGAGPRATPTLAHSRLYTFGATGILNALDSADGRVMWSRNVASDTGKKVPYWGFAGSPLVVDDLILVAAAGQLAAYELATGEPRWFGPDAGAGYSSPHLLTIDGIEQILLLNGAGVISVAPSDGRLLWEHAWPGDGIVQPALAANGDVLIGTGSGISAAAGTRRIAVSQAQNEWTVEERWTSIGLKPYFNDFVIHNDYAYGFDGGILACIDIESGGRCWKGGRYGHGQLVLLPDQDLLLVLSERGELALVAAVPDQFVEFARFPAMEGKTWNHPVLVGDILLVRNDQEMAAFKLALAAR